MTADEVASLGRLVARTASGGTAGIQELHAAIAGRAFGAAGLGLGVAVRPVQAMHDGIAALSYGGVRLGLRVGITAAGNVAGACKPLATAPLPLSDDRRAAFALAVLNGWVGDELDADGDPLATTMALRVDGRAVDPVPGSLAAAYPAATGRLVVFLPGLVETEFSWWPRHEGGVCFGELLERDLGITPLWVRYNTGLHISTNGRLLCDLLQQVVQAWPVRVDDLVLVGHSMGGLVARSALHQDLARTTVGWSDLLRANISLGSPHVGAPLERAVNRAVRGLLRLPETRPLAAVLSRRSAGIKDLRHGNLLDGDWDSYDPEHPHDVRTHVPLSDQVPHYVVYATVTGRPDHPVAEILGDLLVTPSSATGRGVDRRPPWNLPGERVLHLGGRHHFDLLDHPQVYVHLRQWISSTLIERRVTSAAADHWARALS
jgi:pimeloyl-ACP methyl ester carboxylesterase